MKKLLHPCKRYTVAGTVELHDAGSGNCARAKQMKPANQALIANDAYFC